MFLLLFVHSAQWKWKVPMYPPFLSAHTCQTGQTDTLRVLSRKAESLPGKKDCVWKLTNRVGVWGTRPPIVEERGCVVVRKEPINSCVDIIRGGTKPKVGVMLRQIERCYQIHQNVNRIASIVAMKMFNAYKCSVQYKRTLNIVTRRYTWLKKTRTYRKVFVGHQHQSFNETPGNIFESIHLCLPCPDCKHNYYWLC